MYGPSLHGCASAKCYLVYCLRLYPAALQLSAVIVCGTKEWSVQTTSGMHLSRLPQSSYSVGKLREA
jgi:hypothetical protein